MQNEIEWSDDKEITDLIYELAQLLESGYTTVKIQTYQTGEGTRPDGSYEYYSHVGKIVAD